MLFELFLEGDISKTIATIHITEVDRGDKLCPQINLTIFLKFKNYQHELIEQPFTNNHC